MLSINEDWKLVSGFINYKISNSGVVKSLRYGKEKTLKTRLNKKGYVIVSLINEKGCRVLKVHRLVALHFVENVYNKPQVNHDDGNKQNNHHSNLEWCTNLENNTHARKNGLINDYGINNKVAKLTDSDVVEIRNSSLYQKDLALKFNVSKSLISRVQLRLAWKHIE